MTWTVSLQQPPQKKKNLFRPGGWGLSRLNFDPRDRSHHPHFFDPHSTIYDGRVAGEQDLCRPLTAEMLRKEAQKLAKRPYSLSEFNCDSEIVWIFFEDCLGKDNIGDYFPKWEIVCENRPWAVFFVVAMFCFYVLLSSWILKDWKLRFIFYYYQCMIRLSFLYIISYHYLSILWLSYLILLQTYHYLSILWLCNLILPTQPSFPIPSLHHHCLSIQVIILF